jgi:hypothetical protein
MHGRPRLKIPEILELTLPELWLALDQNLEEKHRPPSGGVSVKGSAREYAAWWRSLTPLERLERAREKRM